MILLLKLILICHIWVMGITIITQPDMVMERWRVWADLKLKQGKRWTEPLILCHWCMSSIHSVFAYLFAILLGIITKFEWSLIWMYPLIAMGASLLNGVVWGIYKLIEAQTKYYQNSEKLKFFDVMDRKKLYHEKNNQR